MKVCEIYINAIISEINCIEKNRSEYTMISTTVCKREEERIAFMITQHSLKETFSFVSV